MMNDVELRRLAQEPKVAWEFERSLVSQDAEEQAYEAAYEACSKLVSPIKEIQDHTLDGLKAKAGYLLVPFCRQDRLRDGNDRPATGGGCDQ
ncbi:hypothetical protein [Rhizobium sp. BK251]|uniref:hypothetical protein n=1 Tax=Rhizobium sp. BK251 TaxID=2512125 RepID=UPI00104BB8DD|nr:hypothetical protein [Rhizobium sp. BK251]